VISESELKYPFDLNHILITSYTHMGDDIGVSEARRFIELLGGNLEEILQKPEPDSPIYTYLADLTPPQLTEAQQAAVATAERVLREAAGGAASMQSAESEPTLSERVRLGEAAIRHSDFAAARAMFSAALEYCETRDHRQGRPGRREPYLLQRLALTTYKARQPDPVTALREALGILQPLAPEDSNDPETVGIAGSIHKHLYEEGQGKDHLAHAIRYYARGYFLRSDLYHGINLAAQLTLRAASPLDSSDQERISDLVFANRIRGEVLELCERELARIEQRLATSSDRDTKEHQVRQDRDARYWCTASMAEAFFGLGRWEEYQQSRDDALALRPAEWMAASMEKHLATVRQPLEAYGHLLNPPWRLPATLGAGKSPATAGSGA
jgi:hypothetical protein